MRAATVVASGVRARARIDVASRSRDPHEVGRAPPGSMAGVTGGEDGLPAIAIPHESPGLAPKRLVERVRMSGLRGNRFATARTDRPEGRIRFGAERAPFSCHDAARDPRAAGGAGPPGPGSGRAGTGTGR